ncbi:helix-turn-helix domain-containing protein [Sorangium sp. So ce1099]|uniref:helix-turn-helix domain-containing protein n=1 Tax=Sorangium sp. So ce1099 TaxID=3133331 RepID=UPI003F6148A1
MAAVDLDRGERGPRALGRADHRLPTRQPRCRLAAAGNLCHLLPRWRPVHADEILTPPEVAQLLNVAEKTVCTMAPNGEQPAFKARDQWRFKRADLDRRIEDQKAGARDDKHLGDA